MREIRFYKTISGKAPINDFLDSLSSKQAQKVSWVLEVVEELRIIPKQYFKKLVNTDNIWEVRVSLGSNIYRLLGFLMGTILLFLPMVLQKRLRKLRRKKLS